MIYALKIKLHLNEKEKSLLDSQSMICNWAYNHILEIANDLRVGYISTQDPEIGKILYTERGLRDLLPS